MYLAFQFLHLGRNVVYDIGRRNKRPDLGNNRAEYVGVKAHGLDQEDCASGAITRVYLTGDLKERETSPHCNPMLLAYFRSLVGEDVLRGQSALES